MPPRTKADLQRDRVEAFMAQRERDFAAESGADLAEDRAALIAGFFEGRADPHSEWHDHPVVGPVLERAKIRYGELRAFDFRFASRISSREAVREPWRPAPPPPQAEGDGTATYRDALLHARTAFHERRRTSVPRWPQPPQWADRVVHVEPAELAACLVHLGRPRRGRDGSAGILTVEAAVTEWTRDGTAEVDAYVLQSPSGQHSGQFRYGADGGDYLSPQFDQERLSGLLEDRAAEPASGPRP